MDEAVGVCREFAIKDKELMQKINRVKSSLQATIRVERGDFNTKKIDCDGADGDLSDGIYQDEHQQDLQSAAKTMILTTDRIFEAEQELNHLYKQLKKLEGNEEM